MSRHNAPPVVYPVKRSSAFGWCLLVFWAAGACVLVLWVQDSAALGWRTAVAPVVAVGTSLAALASWRASCCGQLAWDGQYWHWDSPGDLSSSEQSKLSVIVDAQSALLLVVEAVSGATHWLWVERSSQPERWTDLRRAVYSPHREPTLPAESSSSSSPIVEKLNQ